MAHKVPHVAIAVLLTAAAWLPLEGDARAEGYGAPGWASPEPNFYAMPTGSEGLTAALYPSPRPTPPLVGQTYITYQPLAPQEFMYSMPATTRPITTPTRSPERRSSTGITSRCIPR